jgi:predicted Zn-dependent protease
VAGVSADQDALIELTAAQGSAAEAARAFAAQEGLQAGTSAQSTIHGNRAVSVPFDAQSDQSGSVRGVATFIEYGGATWGITAFSVADRFAAYSSAMQRTVDSFARLTDATALAVQPLHLSVDRAPRAMSLQQFNTQLPSSISFAELAIINGLDEGAQLRSGQQIKRVVGKPVVSSSGDRN